MESLKRFIKTTRRRDTRVLNSTTFVFLGALRAVAPGLLRLRLTSVTITPTMNPIRSATMLFLIALQVPALLGVEQKPTEPPARPPSTDPVLDYSLLKGEPLDHWYSFYIDGKK